MVIKQNILQFRFLLAGVSAASCFDESHACSPQVKAFAFLLVLLVCMVAAMWPSAALSHSLFSLLLAGQAGAHARAHTAVHVAAHTSSRVWPARQGTISVSRIAKGKHGNDSGMCGALADTHTHIQYHPKCTAIQVKKKRR